MTVPVFTVAHYFFLLSTSAMFASSMRATFSRKCWRVHEALGVVADRPLDEIIEKGGVGTGGGATRELRLAARQVGGHLRVEVVEPVLVDRRHQEHHAGLRRQLRKHGIEEIEAGKRRIEGSDDRLGAGRGFARGRKLRTCPVS